MLVIRLLRAGKKNQPFFKIVVIDKRKPSRSGRFLERVGFWNPLTKEKNFNPERIKYWLSKGAKPSDTVYNLLISEKILEGKKIPKHKKAKKKEKAPKEEKKVEVKEEAKKKLKEKPKAEPKKEKPEEKVEKKKRLQKHQPKSQKKPTRKKKNPGKKNQKKRRVQTVDNT